MDDRFPLAGGSSAGKIKPVAVGPVVFGGPDVPVIAGPCSVETEEILLQTARAAREAGASLLRGGAFKPRSSPHTFRGLGEEGLKLLALAREETGLPVVTEVLSPRDVELVARYADMLQIGSRNMQNFPLLQEAGRSGKPVLLKRGFANTIEEWIWAAEYVLAEGGQVVLCERGIRTFERATRNTLDLSAIPVIHSWTHLPVCVDPSHGVGHSPWIPAMARAAVAAGADGLMLEVHPQPEKAWSDGRQSLDLESFRRLMASLPPVAEAIGRRMAVAALVPPGSSGQ